MGIDLQARSVSDSQKIHNGTLGTGGFNVSLKFTSLVPEVLTIQGLFNDTSLNINPETGMLMIGSKIAISFHQSDLTIWDGLSTLARWKIEFNNGAGQTVICEIDPVMPDRSFGDILVMCKIISGHK
jgi:hypothetical protein